MAFSGVIGPPKIVIRGGAEIIRDRYLANTEDDFSAGDFLRITNDTGEVEPTDVVNTDNTGGLQCMAIQDYDASEDGNIYVPVIKITQDTIFAQQVTSGTPSQSDIGSRVTLDLTTGKNAPTATTTKGVAEIVDIALNKKWMYSSENICGEYGIVYFKIIPSIVTASKVAAT